MNPHQPWSGQPPQHGYYGGQPGYPGYPQPGHGYGGYEFNAAENQVLGGAATWTLVLGIVNIVNGALQVVSRSGLNGMVSIAIGCGLIAASMAFKKVVTTQGNDVRHLLDALKTFSTILICRIVLLCLAAGIVLIVGLGFAVFAILTSR